MNVIQIDPLDMHSMERLAAAQNAVALVRFQKQHESFFSAHAQTMLAIYVHLTDLAEGHAVSAEGANFTPIAGGNETSVQSDNKATTTSVSALVNAKTPTPKPQDASVEAPKGKMAAALDEHRAAEAAQPGEPQPEAEAIADGVAEVVASQYRTAAE